MEKAKAMYGAGLEVAADLWRAPAIDPKLVERLQAHLTSQLDLCAALETIADGLPDNVCRQTCLHAARSIYPIVKSAHEFEEDELFPAIKEVFLAQDTRPESPFERLMEEHWEDESFGQELAEVIREFVAGRDTNTDKLSYMLRGFFEGLRRHIAFEKEVFTPIFATQTA
ncbi:MAG: hemerythrin domain-containing protein [Pseudomonadota bacterium]